MWLERMGILPCFSDSCLWEGAVMMPCSVYTNPWYFETIFRVFEAVRIGVGYCLDVNPACCQSEKFE